MTTILLLEVRLSYEPNDTDTPKLMHHIGEWNSRIETVRRVGKTTRPKRDTLDGPTNPTKGATHG